MPTIINPERQAKKKAMVGEKSGKSFKRKLKAARAVRPQYYKDLSLVPTKRIRIPVSEKQ